MFHTANRIDAVAAYVADGLRVGVEYFNATDFSAALVTSVQHARATAPHGESGFRVLHQFLPNAGACSAAARSSIPTPRPRRTRKTSYYTVGIQYSPVKIVDLSLGL